MAVLLSDIRQYPYFTAWLAELGRSADDLANFGVRHKIKEIAPENGWKRYAGTGDFVAHMMFQDGKCFEREGKWSEEKMHFIPQEEKENEQ